MFGGSRYVTRGVNADVGLDLQLILWGLIDDLKNRTGFQLDYLQVFDLEYVKGVQKITHKQECPPYRRVHHFRVENPIDAKLFVIDDGNGHTTMMFNYEY